MFGKSGLFPGFDDSFCLFLRTHTERIAFYIFLSHVLNPLNFLSSYVQRQEIEIEIASAVRSRATRNLRRDYHCRSSKTNNIKLQR